MGPSNTEAKVNGSVWRPSQEKLKLLFLDSLFLGPCLKSRDERRGKGPPGCDLAGLCSGCNAPLPWSPFRTEACVSLAPGAVGGWQLCVACAQLKGAMVPRSCPLCWAARILGLVNMGGYKYSAPSWNLRTMLMDHLGFRAPRELAEFCTETASEPSSLFYPFQLPSLPCHRCWPQKHLLLELRMLISISSQLPREPDSFLLCFLFSLVLFFKLRYSWLTILF